MFVKDTANRTSSRTRSPELGMYRGFRCNEIDTLPKWPSECQQKKAIVWALNIHHSDLRENRICGVGLWNTHCRRTKSHKYCGVVVVCIWTYSKLEIIKIPTSVEPPNISFIIHLSLHVIWGANRRISYHISHLRCIPWTSQYRQVDCTRV
jgi:hypothetical protein